MGRKEGGRVYRVVRGRRKGSNKREEREKGQTEEERTMERFQEVVTS